MTLSPNLASPSEVAVVETRHSGRKLGPGFFSICLALIIAAYAFTKPLHDFVEYWTAAHLLVAHQNPYSLAAVFNVQRSLGWPEPIPLTFVSPPWALCFIAPLGLIKSYPLAWLAWFSVMATAAGISSWLLVQMYFGEVRLPEITEMGWQRFLFAFTFYPVLLCLKFSQTAPLILLGIVGFLYFQSKSRPILAGLLLSLTLIKPQLAMLIWLALFLRSLKQRRWTTIASSVAALCFLTAIALLLDPEAFRQYCQLARTPYLSLNPSGIVAVVRGLLGGRNTFWLQFIPPVAGIFWLAHYWYNHRIDWNWSERMPVLVTACMLTSAYGWLFDQTLLAVPIIALAGKYAREFGHLPRNMVFLYTGLNITLILLAMASSPWGFMPAPIIIAFLLYREAHNGDAHFSSVRYGYIGS